ncbi:amidohydrolase family protein [Fuchsiella alkaliacetigena]|uniref:amidohydrolase family protein n=1 Tax=Fuchsiella alkaliacetigena TaxID=957042 RepID=UPI00200B0D0E|nr:amidohydrolase [Fuchsiella alkaliacetigena]MCK8825919.1 amidohydrolase [Fuchsiella alkaliacetigena]
MILTADWVLPISSQPLSKGAVMIKEGIIQSVGRRDSVLAKYPKQQVKDLGSVILMPGLVNLHTHLDYTVLRGLGDDLIFFPWLSNLVRKSRSLDYRELLLSAKLGALELLAGGVTTIADTTATGASLEAATELGLRGIIYQEVFGLDVNQLNYTLNKAQRNYENLKSQAGERLRVGLAPHATYSVGRDLFRRLDQLSQAEGIPLCTHVAETQEELDCLLAGRGPLATDYRRAVGWQDIFWKPPRQTPVKYLADLGVLSDRLLAVHLVHANQEEFEILAEAGVKVAYCPKSNAKLGSGIADLPAMLENNLLVGLGTDSAVSNNSLDLFSEMEFGLLVQRAEQQRAKAVTAQEMVELVTIGGARALGLAAEIGTLEPGKKADLTAVKIDNLANQPVYDPYSTLVYTASSRDVIMTMIDGEIVYQGGPEFGEQYLKEVRELKKKIETGE